MATRRELTKKTARAYVSASKGEKGRLLDELCASTGWSRDNARRALRNALKRRGPASARERKPRPRTYGYDVLKVLIHVWRAAGEPCGKYLVPVMGAHLIALEQHGELGDVARRLTPEVRAQLLSMSAATIDRHLAPTRRARDPESKSTTRRGPLLREQIPIRPATADTETRPGFFEIDLVAHCGHSTSGQYAFTLTATDVHLGWTIPVALPNKAHRWVVEAVEYVADTLPYPLVGLDCDNGGEFINHTLIRLARDRRWVMTRSRPHTSNDNAHVEQRNGDWVRRNAYRHRYDTAAEVALLTDLWELVCLRKNYLLPTKKATGWAMTKAGRSVRTYDQPRTPCQRLIDSGFLTDEQTTELTTIRDSLNPAEITRRISAIQQQLLAHTRGKNPLPAAA